MVRNVLVGVLKDARDLRVLLEAKWYRIPLSFLPKRSFTHIAFYAPVALGRNGRRVEYYARVSKREVKKRIELIPEESEHPRAPDEYLKCSFKRIHKLANPIRNIIPRRVSFGFTDLKTLRSARNILELYHVSPTEQLIEEKLSGLGIPFISQYRISLPANRVTHSVQKRFILDLAIFCRNGKMAIECDNRKAHAGNAQKQKDREKDAALRHAGWRVIRLTESDILDHRDRSFSRIQTAIRSLGGCIRS